MRQDESVAPSTASLESLFVTLLVEQYEGIDAAITDVLGAYLHATLSSNARKERVLIKLEGYFVDIVVKINPEHEKHIIFENGKKVLYL